MAKGDVHCRRTPCQRNCVDENIVDKVIGNVNVTLEY